MASVVFHESYLLFTTNEAQPGVPVSVREVFFHAEMVPLCGLCFEPEHTILNQHGGTNVNQTPNLGFRMQRVMMAVGLLPVKSH